MTQMNVTVEEICYERRLVTDCQHEMLVRQHPTICDSKIRMNRKITLMLSINAASVKLVCDVGLQYGE